MVGTKVPGRLTRPLPSPGIGRPRQGVDGGAAGVFIAAQIGQNLPLLQQASAATVLVALPIVVLAMVVQRFLVAGLTGG